MLGSMIGGMFSYLGQQSANNTNVNLQNQANQFNAKEAEKNRDWQAEMSNTAKQREKADLEKAGLNPLLAATGGASTPGGGAASGSAPVVENALGKAVTSAIDVANLQMSLAKQKEEIGLMQANKAKAEMDTAVASKSIPEAEARNWLWKKFQHEAQTTSKDFSKLKEQLSIGLPSLKHLFLSDETLNKRETGKRNAEKFKLRLNKP